MAKSEYDLTRYFGNGVPGDVCQTLEIPGIRVLKPGSKFKIANERGDFTFIYARQDSITCFTPQGQVKTISFDKVKRVLNRSKRERLSGK